MCPITGLSTRLDAVLASIQTTMTTSRWLWQPMAPSWMSTGYSKRCDGECEGLILINLLAIDRAAMRRAMNRLRRIELLF